CAAAHVPGRLKITSFAEGVPENVIVSSAGPSTACASAGRAVELRAALPLAKLYQSQSRSGRLPQLAPGQPNCALAALPARPMQFRFERAITGAVGRRQGFIEDGDGAFGIARPGLGLR